MQHCKDEWEGEEWAAGTKPMTKPTKPQSTIGDFDHSVPEYDTKVQDAHYLSKIETHSMNIVCEPGGRHSYLWSEKDAGKKSCEFMSVLKYHWSKRSVGAGKGCLTMDGANTNVNQQFFKWCHWISSEWNKFRLFLAFLASLLHRGHSYNPADTVGGQKESNCCNCDVFKNTKHRVEFLNNRNTSLKVTQLIDEFFEYPENFDEIYLPLSKWKDDKGQKLLIRDDKPIILHFQESEVWDVEKKEWKTVQHPNEIYVRQSWDFKVPPRVVRIVKPDFDPKTFDFSLIQYKKAKKPKVKQNKIDGTMKLVHLAQDKDMIEYYSGFNNIDKTPSLVQDRKPTTAKRFEILMKRICILDSNQKYNKTDPLPKFEKKKNKNLNKNKSVSGNKRKKIDKQGDIANNRNNNKNKNDSNDNNNNKDNNNNGNSNTDKNSDNNSKTTSNSNDNNNSNKDKLGEPPKKRARKIIFCKRQVYLNRELSLYSKKQLAAELTRHKLPHTGRRKQILVDRLAEHIKDFHSSGQDCGTKSQDSV